MNYYKQLKGNNLSANVPLGLCNPLDEILTEYSNCRLCGLCSNREDEKKVVFGLGALRPKIMFIGDIPSGYESESGIPFTDQVHRKLAGMTAYLKSKVELNNNVYATNLVLCPGIITEEAIASCNSRLLREVQIVSPKMLVLLGDVVVDALRENFTSTTIQRRKRLVVKLDKFYPTVVTHSLRELFYNNSEVREEVRDDLDFIIKVLYDIESNIRKSRQAIS